MQGNRVRLPQRGVGFGPLIAGITGGYVWQQFSDTTGLITCTSVAAVGLGTFLYDSIST
jgi:xanthine/uracil permease